MKNRVDMHLLAVYVRTKRGNQSFREAASEIGNLSSSTLLRVEREEVPDIAIFLRLCDWLQMPASTFIQPDEEAEQEVNVIEAIERLLLADGVLDLEIIHAFVTLLKAVRFSANHNRV